MVKVKDSPAPGSAPDDTTDTDADGAVSDAAGAVCVVDGAVCVVDDVSSDFSVAGAVVVDDSTGFSVAGAGVVGVGVEEEELLLCASCSAFLAAFSASVNARARMVVSAFATDPSFSYSTCISAVAFVLAR